MAKGDAGGDQFARHARAVAVELYGDPNKQLSGKDELRFGAHGSVSVDLRTGQFYNHEQNEGGGVLWAIEAVTGQPVAGGKAVEWMRDHGFDVEDNRPATAPSGQSGGGARFDPAGNWLPERVPDHGRMTAAYDYRNADGSIAYQVCRYDWEVPKDKNPKGREKTFVQRRPDKSKKNGWTYKVRGAITPLPYRLPELIDDIAAGLPIFMVEGEKKVDMLREIGVPATCNSGGAGKFPDELTQWFNGADLVILPDNDPQAKTPDGKLKFHEDGRPVHAGQDHADLIGRRLDGIARRVRVLQIPDLPPKGGVDDWLPAGGTAEKLYELLDTTAKPFVAAPFKSMFGAVEWRDFDTPGRSYEYLIKGVLTKGEQSMLLGESQSGKSFLAIDIAMSVARGIDWFGHKAKRGGVIYQAGESAVGVRRRRFPAYRQENDVAKQPLSVVLLERPVDFYNSDEQVEQFIEECKHWAKTFADPLELIVIDTFNKATPGANENDGKDMGMVLARCDRIRAATGAHVMLVHHLNAGGTKARGHTSLFANVENVVTVKRVEDAVDGDGRKVREWVVSKQKDGEDGIGSKFVLKGVQIGIDDDGDPITSCVVAKAERAGAKDANPEGITVAGFNAVILRAIYTAIEKQGVLAPGDLDLPRGALVADRAMLWEEYRATIEDDPDDVRDGETEDEAKKRRQNAQRQAVKRARDFLYSKKVIGAKDDWIWLTGRDVKGFEPAPGQGEAAQRRSIRKSDDKDAALDLPFDVGEDNLPADADDFK